MPEITLWILLFLLIPGTAFGYFAEKSLPGSPLYPLKRNIEKIVLTAESFDKTAQASYQLYLTSRRFDETTKLLDTNTLSQNTTTNTTQDLVDLSNQIQEAQLAIVLLPDTAQKVQLESQLVKNISAYQEQLNTYQLSLKNRIRYRMIMPTPYQNMQQSQNPTPVENNFNTDNSSEQILQLDQTISQVNEDLNQVQQDAQDQLNPTPTDFPIPTDSPTPTLFPTFTPTPTTTSSTSHNRTKHGDGNGDNTGNQNTYDGGNNISSTSGN